MLFIHISIVVNVAGSNLRTLHSSKSSIQYLRIVSFAHGRYYFIQIQIMKINWTIRSTIHNNRCINIIINHDLLIKIIFWILNKIINLNGKNKKRKIDHTWEWCDLFFNCFRFEIFFFLLLKLTKRLCEMMMVE